MSEIKVSPIVISKIKFSEEDCHKLKRYIQSLQSESSESEIDQSELIESVIVQIEQVLNTEQHSVGRDLFNQPTAKQMRVIIENLRTSTLNLAMQLKDLNYVSELYIVHWSMSMKFGETQRRILKDLERMYRILAKKPLPKHPKNETKEETPYCIILIVRRVAQILIENKIIPIKRNKQFEAIIGIAFKAMQIKASPRVVIGKCWRPSTEKIIMGVADSES